VRGRATRDDAEQDLRDAWRRVDTMTLPVRSGTPTAPAPRPRRGAYRWLAAAAALLLAGGLGAWALAGRGESVPSEPARPGGAPTTVLAAATAAELVGPRWTALWLRGVPARPAPDAVPHLTFADDGSFSGGDPCNGLRGTWVADGDRLGLTIGAMTEIGCDVDQQRAFTTALEDTRRFDIREGLLELRDADGQLLARFAAADGEEPTPVTPSGTAPDEPVSAKEAGDASGQPSR